jgi:enoyl-CoA hydratase/carnithine racemase
MTATVHLQLDAGVATLTVDNPPLNLLSMAVRQRLSELAGELGRNPDCRAVVITGAGERAFSAGSDIREFPRDAAAGTERAELEHAWFAAIENLPQPTIAALHGHVLGGGLELALACDMRIADSTAEFGLPEVGLGLLPSGGGTQRLPRLVGPARAKTLLLLGDRIGAEQAERYGLVERVVPPGQAVSAARQAAERVAAATPAAARAIKRAVDVGLAEGMAAGLALEEEFAGPLFASAEAQQAVQRFLARNRTKQNVGG